MPPSEYTPPPTVFDWSVTQIAGSVVVLVLVEVDTLVLVEVELVEVDVEVEELVLEVEVVVPVGEDSWVLFGLSGDRNWKNDIASYLANPGLKG